MEEKENTLSDEYGVISHKKEINKLRKHLNLLNKSDVKYKLDDNYNISIHRKCEDCGNEMTEGELGFYCMCHENKANKDWIKEQFKLYPKDCSKKDILLNILSNPIATRIIADHQKSRDKNDK